MMKFAKIIPLCFLIAALVVFFAPRPRRFTDLSVGGNKISVEIARTKEEKEKGLSGRDKLAEDKGLLFVYDAPVKPYFWMKGMKFPIDVIWVRDGKIVDYLANLPLPVFEPPLFTPEVSVDSVLEVSAGWTERHGVKRGDEVR